MMLTYLRELLTWVLTLALVCTAVTFAPVLSAVVLILVVLCEWADASFK